MASTSSLHPLNSPPLTEKHWLAALQRRWPELLIVLIGGFTRFWQLGYHSFWYDEAVSTTWARATPERIWTQTFALVADKHPPAYYLLLHFWRQLWIPLGLGENDLALRTLGVLLGMATVAGMLLLVMRLSGRATALLAGGLVAVSPVLVWYSQELRMFQPATAAIVWAAYTEVRALDSRTWAARLGWWASMVAAWLFALYSYLFSAFMLPAAGLVLLVWLGLRETMRRRTPPPPAAANHASAMRVTWRSFFEGVLALGLVALLYLPLARNAWLANAGEGSPGQAFMDFGANLQRQLQVFTVWRVDWPPALFAAALLFFGALALIGLLLPWPRPVRAQPLAAPTPGADRAAGGLPYFDQLWLWAWIGMPLLVGNLLLARNDTIFAEDRYFLFLGPFVLWAVARGAIAVGKRWRPAGWALAAAAVLVLLLALPRLWSPAMLREDWRAAAQYVGDYQTASPGLPAAAVAHVDYTRTALNWYLRQRLTKEQLPVYFPYGGKLAPDQVDSVIAPPLQGIEAAGAATLWLVQSHLAGVDDDHLVEGWLNQHYPLVTEQYPTGIKLSGYALQHEFAALPALEPGAVRPAAELVPGLQLAACEILTPQVNARDDRMHPPSGWVHVRLWWQATAPLAQDYIASVQMIGPEGVWGDRLYRDNETLRRWPTSTWSPGPYLRDEIDVNLNPVTPAGAYPIVVGLRDSSGQPTGATAECGHVEVK